MHPCVIQHNQHWFSLKRRIYYLSDGVAIFQVRNRLSFMKWNSIIYLFHGKHRAGVTFSCYASGSLGNQSLYLTCYFRKRVLLLKGFPTVSAVWSKWTWLFSYKQIVPSKGQCILRNKTKKNSFWIQCGGVITRSNFSPNLIKSIP